LPPTQRNIVEKTAATTPTAHVSALNGRDDAPFPAFPDAVLVVLEEELVLLLDVE